MLSDELRQLLELSGGKIVVSQGDVNDSYVVFKLDQYLKEFNVGQGKRMLEKRDAVLADEDGKLQSYEENRELTDVELLDKINSDIEQLRQRKMEREVENLLEEDSDEYDYDYL